MYKVDIKVVLLGKHDVGKTALVERYLHGKFKDNTVATVGAAFGAKKLNISGREITLGIWDTAGQERYESMSRIYYRSARAAVICYDLTDAKGFDKVKFWVEELLANEENCAIYIVGTKTDLVQEGKERGLDPTVVKSYASSIGARVFESSAKSGAGVDQVFTDIAELFVKKGGTDLSAISQTTSQTSTNLNASNSKPKKCCG